MIFLRWLKLGLKLFLPLYFLPNTNVFNYLPSKITTIGVAIFGGCVCLLKNISGFLAFRWVGRCLGNIFQWSSMTLLSWFLSIEIQLNGTLATYDECISFFADTLHSTLPVCFVGDFNWTTCYPTPLPAYVN